MVLNGCQKNKRINHMVNQSKEKPIERGCRISEERDIISGRGWGGQVTRGDLHEKVLSCGVHSTPWEEWDLRTAAVEGRRRELEVLIIL